MVSARNHGCLLFALIGDASMASLRKFTNIAETLNGMSILVLPVRPRIISGNLIVSFTG